MDNETLMNLTVDIVSAHVGHNRVATNDVTRLIQSVYDALAGAGSPTPAPEEKREPAVAILATDHALSPDDYRARWRLPADYPMVAPDYADKRRVLAKKIGLGRKPGTEVAEAKPVVEAEQ
jgi:predicted transcriptional regulator